MKAGVDRADLAGVITWAACGLAARPRSPLLAGMRLDAADGTLKASAFDYDTAASATTEARVDEPGAVLVPGRLLADIVHSLDGEVAELAVSDTELALRCDGSSFTLAVLPMEEYPSPPVLPAAAGTCDAGEFARAVSRVAVAAATDDTLTPLTGVSFEGGPGAITLAAVDRYRLASAELPWAPASADGAEMRALVPAKILAVLAKSLDGSGTVTISLPGDGLMAGFSDGARELVTRCLAGEFPKWRQFFDGEPSTKIRGDSARLIAAVRQAALGDSAREQVVRMTVTDDAVQFRAASDGRSADIEVSGVSIEGGPVSTAFAPARLTDGLAAAGSTVRIELQESGGSRRPARIVPEDASDSYKYAVVPVRLDG